MFLRTPSLQASENSFGQDLIINLERISEKVFNLILRIFFIKLPNKGKNLQPSLPYIIDLNLL